MNLKFSTNVALAYNGSQVYLVFLTDLIEEI